MVADRGNLGHVLGPRGVGRHTLFVVVVGMAETLPSSRSPRACTAASKHSHRASYSVIFGRAPPLAQLNW